MGHIRRCMTLAQFLAKLGARVRFILNDDIATYSVVSAKGFDAVCVCADRDLKQTPETLQRWNVSVLIADSYALSTDWWGPAYEHV